MKGSPTTLLATDLICLEPGDAIDSQALRRTAACIRSLRPRIAECRDRHGDGVLLAALMVTIAELAADHGTTGLIADALHTNAVVNGQVVGW